VMPPNVSYELTPMGTALREAAAPLLAWSIAHLSEIDAARSDYDTRADASSAAAAPGSDGPDTAARGARYGRAG
jgi:hypothetical protein